MIDYVQASGFLVKRALVAAKAPSTPDNGNANLNLPTWGWFIILFDVIVFLPAFIFIAYTLGTIYPTLAIVEDPNPPAYDPVPLNDDAADEGTGARENAAEQPWKPITSSLRSINRLLYSVAGWRANFRGAFCAIVIFFLTGLFGGFFAALPFVPAFVGTLLASLALVQLSAAWVHIVISAPSPAPFIRRLPPFGKTLQATALPVLLYWSATTLAQVVPQLLAGVLGLQLWDPKNPNDLPQNDPADAVWKGSVLALVALAISFLVVIPAHVLLTRVQASLLPPDVDAIVPFDRSFGGKVEPAIVGGKGYVSIRDAFKSFPRSSWVRLYLLLLKTFLVAVAIDLIMCAVVIPEVILMSKYAPKAGDPVAFLQ